MGTAKLFDPLGESASGHAAMRAKCLGDRQGVRRRRRLDGAHIPQRARAVLVESTTIEARKIFRLYSLCANVTTLYLGRLKSIHAAAQQARH